MGATAVMVRILSLLLGILATCTNALPTFVPDLDIILYGASGCVGHLAAFHLANQTGLRWAIADYKNTSKFQELAANLAAGGGPSSKPEQMIFPLDGSTDVRQYVRRTRAVATAAGPFSVHGGEVLLSACAELGVHYTDTSDEFYWQRWMIDRHDTTAKASGAKIALSTGFCVLAGDLGTQLALKALPSHGNISVDAWLETYNGGLSSGVINTGKAIKNASYPKAWNTDPYVLAPKAPASLRVDSTVAGIRYPAYAKGEGAIVANIFGPYDARLLRRSFTQLGQRVKLRVGATPSVYAKWAAFLAVHPKSWSSLTKCPSTGLLAGGSWKYRFHATAGTTSTSLLLKGSGDPGYHFTAVGLAEAALCLSGQTVGCRDDSKSGGVYTSMSAMDPLVLKQRLTKIGLIKFS